MRIVSYDNVCKLLAEKYPVDFARWLLTTRIRKVEVLKTELSIEPVRADSVIFLRTGKRILHIEFQTLTQSQPPIPFRALDYSVRLKRQYEVPVTQVIIFLQPTNDAIAYTDEYRDETTIHKYRVIRMWEEDPNQFFNSMALLPLAPLAQTSLPKALLSQVAQKIATIENQTDRQNTAAYTEILAGLKFKKDLIRSLLSEDIMKESVIYQDIFQKGRTEGRTEGQIEGEENEAFRFLNRLLNRKFGNIDASILERIRPLSKEQLEALGEECLDFSDVSNLENWLNQEQES